MGCESMLMLAMRMRTRSPSRTNSGSVPGKTRLLKVKTLKSSIIVGSGVEVPGLMNHSLRKMAKSRSIRRTGLRGWKIRKPIIPIDCCTISSKCGWYIWVPCWRTVNSYLKVSPGSMRGWLRPATPSMPLGSRTPCQCTEVGSGRRFST